MLVWARCVRNAAVSIATLLLAAGAAAALQAPELDLIPYPQQVHIKDGRLHLPVRVRIAVPGRSAEDRFAASTLANDLAAIDDVHATVGTASAGARVVLLRSGSAAGRLALRRAGLELPPSARDEGYALIVSHQSATVVAATPAGVFYGVQTLRQLIHPGPRNSADAPAVTILDWPSMKWRGIHDDISRGPVPTLDSIKHYIELMSEYKVNLYSPYFENTFEYQSLPLVGAYGGALTHAEAREIVAFAAQYHVTVVPEQEAFGHMHLALQYERYQDMVEVPYGHTLSPASPESLQFIGSMFSELAAVFPGPFLHIGADETFELGQGRTRAMAEQRGSGQVYIDYIRQIDEVLRPYHRQVLFWGDIAYRHPELLNQLPHDMTAVAWVYEPLPDYTKYVKPFRDVGLEVWVAPSARNYNRIYPDFAEALPNIRDFTAQGRALGADGLLNTTWMDDGESLFNATWYALVYGAAAGWQEKMNDPQYHDAFDWAFYRADGHNFVHEIDELTQIHVLMKGAIHEDAQDWMTWLDPFSPRGMNFYTRFEPAAHQVRLLAEDVMSDLAKNRGGARREGDLLDYVDFAARRLDFLGEKAIYAKYINDLYTQAQQANTRAAVNSAIGRISQVNGLVQDMRDADTSLERQYRSLWLGECRPYFLDNILVRYTHELNYWQNLDRRFTDIRAQYRPTQGLPPLVGPEFPQDMVRSGLQPVELNGQAPAPTATPAPAPAAPAPRAAPPATPPSAQPPPPPAAGEARE
jgi:hexosaminidase